MILAHMLAVQQDHLTWPDAIAIVGGIFGFVFLFAVVLYFTGRRRR